MMTIFRATGKIGRTTAAELRGRGHEMRAIVREPARAERIDVRAGGQVLRGTTEIADALAALRQS